MNLIMFDMDGTLVDSSDSIANTINHVRENLNFEHLEKNYILEKVNDPTINPAKFFYGTENFTQEQKELFEKHYDEHCLTDLHVYDGITNLLDDLKDDFILTVATNANSVFAKKMLSHVGLEKYFSTIYGFDSVSKPKPNPEMVYKTLEKHDIKKHKAQLIGDSKKDIQAANNAGIDSVLVNWGFSNHENEAIETVKELEQKIIAKFS